MFEITFPSLMNKNTKDATFASNSIAKRSKFSIFAKSNSITCKVFFILSCMSRNFAASSKLSIFEANCIFSFNFSINFFLSTSAYLAS